MTRSEVLSQAVDQCLKEMYSYVQPSIKWEDFVKENKEFMVKHHEWEKSQMKEPYREYCGPSPFEFYYLPEEILKEICDKYVNAYKIDSQQNLLDIIETLKSYFEEPIVDKYVKDYTDEYGNYHPGHRGYDYLESITKAIESLIPNSNTAKELVAKEIWNKIIEYFDKAGKFFNWNAELNSFNMSVYLGPSPNSNKEAVIENWKKYRDKDIEIDEEQIKKEYYT